MTTTYCDYYSGHAGYEAYHGCPMMDLSQTYCDYYSGHAGYEAYHGCETPAAPADKLDMICAALTEILDILRKTPHEGSGYHKIVNGLGKPIHIRIDPPDNK